MYPSLCQLSLFILRYKMWKYGNDLFIWLLCWWIYKNDILIQQDAFPEDYNINCIQYEYIYTHTSI
jgi:hypothetical protein